MTGKPLHGHSRAVTSVAFGTTPDGRTLLATGSDDHTVRLWEWDPTTRTMTGKPLHGHSRAVTSVAFGTTPDGRTLLATGSDDHTVRLWKPASRQCLGILERRSEVHSLGGASQMLAIGDGEGVSVIELSGLDA
ncbi:hypothetical protein KRR37_14175 [Streptomyces sp. HNA39]|nr:hypothetical protein KRR37_14175 [Streptomyces sp. HNA39]